MNNIKIELDIYQLNTLVAAIVAGQREIHAEYKARGHKADATRQDPEWQKLNKLRDWLEPLANQNPTPESLDHAIKFGYLTAGE